MIARLKKLDTWYDNLDSNPRFMFFLFVVGLPFIVAMQFPMHIISQLVMIAVIAWTVFRIIKY